MRLGNNPTRKQERQRRALARMANAPDVQYIQGTDAAECRHAILERHAKERATLEARCAEPDVRRIRTKKDRTARAKFHREGA